MQAGVGGLKANCSLPFIKKFGTFSFFSSNCCARLLDVVEAEAAIVGVSCVELIFNATEDPVCASWGGRVGS